MRLISKSKFSVKILYVDIKSEFIQFYRICRSKIDRFSHCYLHVNLQYLKNVVI